MASAAPRPTTLAELGELPEGSIAELVGGEVLGHVTVGPVTRWRT